MTRIVMLGMSGLDADLLRVYGPSLPNIRRLMLESPFLELKSTFPPEAASAWTSIYTGLNPANHGIIDGWDYQEENHAKTAPELLQGRAFWDFAGEAGKRVCIVNPLCAYPVWQVNGVMISSPPPSLKQNTVSVIPEEALAGESFPSLPNLPLPPSTRQLDTICLSLQERTSQQATFGLELFQRELWDIFFLQLDALDCVQHFLWRYSDPSDPTYPGRNEYAGRILDFYRLFDQIIGQFRSSLSKDCVLLVVSGYGHGRRSMYRLNLNEWLRTQGLFTPRKSSLRLLDRRYLAERTKNRSLEFLARLQFQHILPGIIHRLPNRKMLPAYTVDQRKTLAQVAGATSFGGICLNSAAIAGDGQSYEELRNSLLSRLRQIRLKSRPVMNWVSVREDVYRGKYLERYPDILFELQSDFGVSQSLYVPLSTADSTHRIISGSHRLQGVLLLGNKSEEVNVLDDTNEPSVMDVAPTILHMIDAPANNFDGRALVQLCAAKQLT